MSSPARDHTALLPGDNNSSSGFYSARHFYGRRTNIFESGFKINMMNSAYRTGMMVMGSAKRQVSSAESL